MIKYGAGPSNLWSVSACSSAPSPTFTLPFAVKHYRIGDLIRSFGSRETETLFKELRPSKALRSVAKQALRRLQQLDSTTSLRDLNLPGNRREKLRGEQNHQHSIRINDQWRICFHWKDGDAYDVEIIDYH